MITLLRITAIVLAVLGIVVGVEILPTRADAEVQMAAVVECLMQDRSQRDATPPVGEVGPPIGVDCKGYLPSSYAFAGGLLAALLVGGFASLLYNTKRSRELMERFDEAANRVS